MDFSRGPPDTSGMDRKQMLEVMREYRRWKEQPKTYDFSLGPPDVSALEGTEQLAVLRQYRQYVTEQADSAPPTPKVSAGVACNFKKDDDEPCAGEEELEIEVAVPASPAASLCPAAGLVSGATANNPVTYFDPVSRAPTQRSGPPEAWGGLSQPPPSPPKPAPPPKPVLPHSPDSPSAGVKSKLRNSRVSEHGFLDPDSPRTFRSMKPEPKGATEQRIFATELAPNDALTDRNRQRHTQLLEARMEEQSKRLEKMSAALREHPAVAGVPSGPAVAATTEENTEPPITEPFTVGLTSRAALEAKRQWLAEKYGVASPRKPGSAVQGAPAGQPAGMLSSFKGRVSVRGAVGALDATDAADYNLQVKMRREGLGDASAQRSAQSVAPWLGGGEVEQPPATPVALCQPANAPKSRVLGAADLSSLSHREKLEAMREARRNAGAVVA